MGTGPHLQVRIALLQLGDALLGVPQLKTVDFYIEEIFPRLSSLMQTVPEAGEFVAHMLSNLDSLVSEGGERRTLGASEGGRYA